MLVAQGGSDTTQVYSPLTAWTPEDVSGASVVNAVLELDAAPHVQCAPEVVGRYIGRGELPSDVGRWQHVNTDGLIDMLLNHPYAEPFDMQAHVTSLAVHLLDTEWRHESTDIYTVVEQTTLTSLRPKVVSKKVRDSVQGSDLGPGHPGDADDDDGLASLFARRGADVESLSARRQRRKGYRRGKADPDAAAPTADAGAANGIDDVAPLGMPPVSEATDKTHRGLDDELENLFDLPAGPLSELFNGPDPNVDGVDIVEEGGDILDNEGSEISEEEEDDPGAPDLPVPPPPPTPSEPRPRPPEPRRRLPPHPATARAVDITEEEVCDHYGLEVIDHVYSTLRYDQIRVALVVRC